MNCGEFNKKIELLEYVKAIDGAYRWTVGALCFAKVVPKTRIIWTGVGSSTPGAEFVFRKVPFTQHGAIRCDGRIYFVGGIEEPERRYLKVSAASGEMKNCIAQRINCRLNELQNPVYEREIAYAFEGCAVEKYAGFEDKKAAAVSKLNFVLVVPKVILLEPGDRVSTEGKSYLVTTAHLCGEFKNEYELSLSEDF